MRILWINRKENIPYCGWELKTPTTSIEDPELLENATEPSEENMEK